ncbi:hypothetical protein [Pararhodobacter zhoushanensis]|uniref:hypothetical protein n=1 Tax=Pararhodobacter zhoushanensis TaxID=2479545 RepID=UPI000F8F3F5B|nr:hypothetical protein [Pararhodobacter zhoushanensis]
MTSKHPSCWATAHERARARLAAARTVKRIQPDDTPLRTTPLVIVIYLVALASLAFAIALPFVM